MATTIDLSKPTAVRLGEMKPHLQRQAFDEERSLHEWIVKIIRDHLVVTDPTYKRPKKINK